MSEETEDEKAFGSRAWIYCDQHMRPHETGWCTVGVSHKRKLDATDYYAAIRECKSKGFALYGGERE